MKKLVLNLNPFILLLIPVLFALVMGISYQFKQAKAYSANGLASVSQTESLFHKGVHLVKAVCSVSKQNLW
ncbi:hypothetical protein KHS38_16610 [Mucilaginibacter sp. Bleaf8]|uniref:hypothetical protein n=1 Tax=Mucilaginibacter sp. Bleaf8 TaxID=2834430 RepID=UPI001BCD1971|nr:hypothetical protein [Mucilaginibacter sp. Bleaf8]MBS7566031.1 hypothetical protein [Mucilaginibacter sp. Bleaf8]